MFQQTIVIGRPVGVGQDPEARCTPTGKWVTHFLLICSVGSGCRSTGGRRRGTAPAGYHP
jgi:hypothetical protein